MSKVFLDTSAVLSGAIKDNVNILLSPITLSELEHIKTAAPLGFYRFPVTGKDAAHFHRDEQPDLFFPAHMTLTRTTSSISRMPLTVSS